MQRGDAFFSWSCSLGGPVVPTDAGKCLLSLLGIQAREAKAAGELRKHKRQRNDIERSHCGWRHDEAVPLAHNSIARARLNSSVLRHRLDCSYLARTSALDTTKLLNNKTAETGQHGDRAGDVVKTLHSFAQRLLFAIGIS